MGGFRGLAWAASFALGALRLGAEVRVAPGLTVLVGGASARFRAVAEGSAEGRFVWAVEAGPGTIDPAAGVYTAPRVQEATQVHVRATLEGCPGDFGEATVVVLPFTHPVFTLVTQVLGGDWVEPYSRSLPFLDLETGERFRPGCVLPGIETRKRLDAAVGVPLPLRWRPDEAPQLMSYRHGDDVVRRDVTGLHGLEIVPRAALFGLRVESLVPDPQGRGWRTHVQRFDVRLRGATLLAGNPVAPPGFREGQGGMARLREPSGLVRVPTFSLEVCPNDVAVVTDRASHVICAVGRHGSLRLLAGSPGRPGHRDSPCLVGRAGWTMVGLQPPAALFNGPTDVAVRLITMNWSSGLPVWDLVVADTGNHVLRRVSPKGEVSTLAGVPGKAGHQDGSDPRRALFSGPRGVAATREGILYVADRGNFVIRVLRPGAGVGTLAGSPGQAGTADGLGPAARFTDLKGIHFEALPLASFLYVLDGHALRRIHLADLRVETLAGVVDQPGFRDLAQPPGEGPEDPRVPCLRDPEGIAPGDGNLLLADRGNQALRIYEAPGTLTTLAGGPETPSTRWGLLRGPSGQPMDARHAGLDHPHAAITLLGSQLLVTSGPCLASLEGHDDLDLDRLTVELEAAPPGVRFQGWTLEPLVPRASRRRILFEVAFLDPEGDVLARTEAMAQSGTQVEVPAPPEAASVRLRTTTDQGLTRTDSLALE